MADEVPDLLREVVSQLQGIRRQLRRSDRIREQALGDISELAERPGGPLGEDWQQEHDDRMADLDRQADEARQEAETARREEREFREAVLLELRAHASLLGRLIERMGPPLESK